MWPWIKGHTDSTLFVTLVATVIGALIVRWGIKLVTILRFETREYITFEADFTQVFRLSEEVSNLEYSVGGKRWKKLRDDNIPFGGNRGNLLLRGRSKYGTKGAYITFATDAQVICTGDIRTLVDYKHYKYADTKEAVFKYLFLGCKQLVVAPELPATKLAESCYRSMFVRCTSLKTAPELPAKKLAENCYYGMFNGCTSLTTPPKLPAKKLVSGCYCEMFDGCASLTTSPELPATTLATNCYSYMFNGCTSLINVRDLTAMKLYLSCYKSMYSGCISLKTAPLLPAIKLAPWCYAKMFFGCISLKTPPVLPALKLDTHCYEDMFNGCTSLSSITMLAVDTNNPGIFDHWLDNTSSEGTFYKNKNAKWNNKGIVPPGWEVESADPEWYN